MKKGISVVIPLYNREELIEETLSSIEGQTLQPYEVIIVDDHSTDSSVNVVNVFKKSSDLNIIILKNGFRKGVSGALNWGVKKANGDFIAIQNSDDLWTSSHLQNLIDALSKFPAINIAFSAIQFFGTAKDACLKDSDFRVSVEKCLAHSFKKEGNGLWVSNDNLLTFLLGYGFPFRCQASLIRRSFFRANNLTFDEDITYTEDAQFMTIAAYFTSFLYYDTVGSLIRRHTENDGDVSYGSKICSSFEIRVAKLRHFFSEHRISSQEKKALKYRLWCLQGYVAEQEAIGCDKWGRAIASWTLFSKVPTWSSFKSAIKLLVQRNPDLSKL